MKVCELMEVLSILPSNSNVVISGGSNLETYLPEAKDVQLFNNNCLLDLSSCETEDRGDEEY